MEVTTPSLTQVVEAASGAVLDAARLLHDLLAPLESTTKAHWSASGDAGYGAIVTRWDVFVQDFIAGRLKAQCPGVCVLGEEKSALLNDDRLDDRLTVVIDPIDGTQWFVHGGYEYSILVTVLERRRPVWSLGVFPRTLDIWVGDFRTLESQPGATPRTLPPSESRRVCAHYRLARPPDASAVKRLEDAGYTVALNGASFGTNLSAVEEVVSGQSIGFIGSKMSIVDGFATAHLIQSAGGSVRFFDVEAPIEEWVAVADWTFVDFGGDVGRRARFIAARDGVAIEGILRALRQRREI